MGKKLVEQTVITDDVDGNALPDDTEPVELVHEGKTYSLYLSNKHRKELLDTLDRFTANVEPVEPAKRERSSRGSKRKRRSSAEVASEKQREDEKRKQRSEIQRFAKRKYPDYTFPQRAAIRSDVVEAFYAEHPDAERHYG